VALESGEVSPFGHDPDLASAPAGEALVAWVREALGGELLERLYALWLRFEGGESKVEWKYLLQARTGGVALWSRAFPYDREDHYRVEGEGCCGPTRPTASIPHAIGSRSTSS
jgi:hypothetical protein